MFANNTKPDLSDKMWKLRPLMNMLIASFSDTFPAITTTRLRREHGCLLRSSRLQAVHPGEADQVWIQNLEFEQSTWLPGEF